MTTILYTPPTLTTPTTIPSSTIGTGFYGPTLTAGTDYIFQFPSSNRTGMFTVTNGRRVQVIGGASVLASGADIAGAITFAEISDSVWLEGLLVDLSVALPTDALHAHGTSGVVGPYPLSADVYICNCYFTGAHGLSTSARHADLFQSQGSVKNLFVDLFTGDSGYQGFFIPPTSGQWDSIHLSRMNLRYNAISPSPSHSFILWFTNNPTGLTADRIYLDQVYIEPRAGQTLNDCVWPPSGTLHPTTGVNIGAVTDDAWATCYWPNLPIYGHITSGPPPGGDFVSSSSVGLGYVSPGYGNHTHIYHRGNQLWLKTVL